MERKIAVLCWNDQGDQSDYQLKDLNARRKLKDKERQSVTSETEPVKHQCFSTYLQQKSKGENLGCFI